MSLIRVASFVFSRNREIRTPWVQNPRNFLFCLSVQFSKDNVQLEIMKREFYKECNFMQKHLEGIALILFGILLMIYASLNPWIPIIGSYIVDIACYGGLIAGIGGLYVIFKKDN